MNTIISWLHAICCIYWFIWIFLNFPLKYWIIMLEKHYYVQFAHGAMAPIICLLGIYLFFVYHWAGWREKIKNQLLQKNLEQLEIQRKINDILDGPNEI